MKKHLILLPFTLALTSCAELQSLATNLATSNNQMPPLTFYEQYAITDNAATVLPLLRQNLTIFVDEDGTHQVFKFSSSLVNETTFNYYDPALSWNFTNVVRPSVEVVNNKVKDVSLSFSSVVNFSHSNFYKIFNLNPNDIKISQLKQHCSDYRRTLPFYKLTTKDSSSLYMIENSESGSADSSTNVTFFNKLPTCKSLGYEKTIKDYGNDSFND
ncbi:MULTISPECIES: hypothetical protein [Mannheimia]|uniref:hypothetical protein n=1 Tax=Mannheimia TaxID=75984 RepID=UPI00159F4D4B|nr:hypothetical protein [Mannheimia pernigra]QLB45108.1 hypothetical protein HV561_10405 [Mannheimia pernigra]